MNPDHVQRLDAEDPLAHKRPLFDLPADTIYLNGNSLGPVSRPVKERLRSVVELQWHNDLSNSWNQHHWIELPLTVGNKIATLIGARAGEVICCDSVSVNLFKTLACALTLQKSSRDTASSGRLTVLSQQDNFPTDLYIAEGITNQFGLDNVELITVAEHQLIDAIKQRPAVLLLTQVNFRTGKVHNIEQLTALAQANGSLVIWDLSHSVGVLPLQVSQWNVDFAVGCGYKYLNGGPGAPAFIYAAENHHENIRQPLQGWMGHKAPFEFSPDYQADDGINQFQCGTPPVLSMSALDAALDLFADIDVSQLRDKSQRLSQLFLEILFEAAEAQGLKLISPQDPELRGGQLGFSHESACAISHALESAGVITDFRSPDILRIGFSPLFLRYQDIRDAGHILLRVMQETIYTEPTFKTNNK